MFMFMHTDHHLDHKHDDRVTSVGIQMDGSCDMAKLNEWLSKLLQVSEEWCIEAQRL